MLGANRAGKMTTFQKDIADGEKSRNIKFLESLVRLN